MTALFLTLALLLQGVPTQPAQTGRVSGTLRNGEGKPAIGVRVTAMPPPESSDEAAAGGTLSSIAETDINGGYTLDGIPPGRYFIAAGRLDFPTFFPGTLAMGEGRLVTIAPGETLQNINFTINDRSTGRADPLLSGPYLPMDVRIEGGKLPVFGSGQRTGLRLTPLSPGPELFTPLTESRINLQPPASDYRVSVEGLPEGYRVRSIQYGGVPISNGILNINTSGGTVSVVTSAVPGLSTSSSPGNLVTTSLRVAGLLQTVTILIETSSPPSTGATVTGEMRPFTVRGISLSGMPGTLFADGTFEFRNVPPGGHVLYTTDNAHSSPPMAASIIVGREDVHGVAFAPTPALPLDFGESLRPQAAGDAPAGPRSLATIRGRVLDGESGSPVPAGDVYLVGDTWSDFSLGADGLFEFSNLLPGKFELEVRGVGYVTFRNAVVVDDQDIDLELRTN